MIQSRMMYACALATATMIPLGCRSQSPGAEGQPRFSRERMQKMIEARKARDKAPKEGEAAPDFTLPTRDGEQTVTLSGFQKDKPVVLIFGSYT